jgi:hypothetical protein
MCGDKRSVDRTPRDFLATWGRRDAGPVPAGIGLDEDRR